MHQMLFEMARGNFNIQIPLEGPEDELETLAVLFNMVAEELGDFALSRGAAGMHDAQRFVTAATLVFDPGCRLRDFSAEVPEMLGYEPTALAGLHIRDIVTPATYELLCEEQEQEGAREAPSLLPLDFVTGQGLLLAAQCSILRLAGGSGTLVSFMVPFHRVIHATATAVPGAELRPRSGHRRSDWRLVHTVYQYIMGHLHQPLPPVKSLANLFGTNEHKLQDVFRHFFKTSIYQFYCNERLERASLMIRQSEKSLKTVALECGFNNYTNFSKAFKRYFGMSPKEVGREI